MSKVRKPKRKYGPKLTKADCLELLQNRVYYCVAGEVWSGKTHRKLTPYLGGKTSGNGEGELDWQRPFVKLRHKDRAKTIAVSNVVWMFYHGQVIPPNFEIHHLDENPFNNNPENLICLHRDDHKLIHNRYALLEIGPPDQTPF